MKYVFHFPFVGLEFIVLIKVNRNAFNAPEKMSAFNWYVLRTYQRQPDTHFFPISELY